MSFVRGMEYGDQTLPINDLFVHFPVIFFHEYGRRVGMVPRSSLKEGKYNQMVEKRTKTTQQQTKHGSEGLCQQNLNEVVKWTSHHYYLATAQSSKNLVTMQVPGIGML